MGSSGSVLSVPQEVEDDVKCARCKELLTCPPIMWYANVGNVCGRCPQEPENGVRNKAYEAVIKHYLLPCRYKSRNCTVTPAWDNVKSHEETCNKRLFDCPALPVECEWEGMKSELKGHFTDKHPTLVYNEPNSVVCFHHDFTKNVFIESMYKPFILHMNYSKAKNRMQYALLFFDYPDKNSFYEFKIELYSDNGSTFSVRSNENNAVVANTLDLSKNTLQVDFDEIPLLFRNSQSIAYKITVTSKTAALK